MTVNSWSMVENGRFTKVLSLALGNADSGLGFDLAAYPDKTVQVIGTYGSATVTLYGSNDPRVLVDNAAGTAWGAVTAAWGILTDTLGNNLAISSANVPKQILEVPRFITSVSAGGTGTALTVLINATRARP